MPWELTGNNINPTTDFLGTTEKDQPLVIKTHGQERMCITADGNVGIGTEGLALSNVRLTIAGPDASTNVETTEVLRLWRPLVTDVKNANSAGFFLGTFEPGGSGGSQLDIKLANNDTASNEWGYKPNATVMSLLSNGNVGIGTTEPRARLSVNGVIESLSGGVRYPDGSVQTTAARQGPPGPKGDKGDPGPAVHTSAVCGPTACAFACHRVVSQQTGPCIVTSDTGSCANNIASTEQYCCVCAP